MAVIVFYTVGNSELHLDGLPLPRGRQRETGQELLSGFNMNAGRLSAPMLSSCLAYISAKHEKIDRLILFATDQPEALGAYRNGDTVFVAKVLEKLLPRLLSSKIAKAEVPALNCDVASYDEVYKWFGNRFKKLGLSGSDVTFYLCPFGGTPAMTMGLLLQGILHHRGGCQVVYVPRGSSDAEAQPFATSFLSDIRKERLAQTLQARDFLSACELASGAGGLMHSLCRYGAARLNSDFAGARQELNKAVEESAAPLKTKLREVRDGLKELQEATGTNLAEKAPPLLEELYYRSCIAWRQGRYDDFLVYLGRFEEVSARMLVEKHLGFSTDMQRKRDRDNFQTGITADQQLSSFLDRQQVDNNPLDRTRVGIPLFLALVRYLPLSPRFANEERTRFSQLNERLAKLDKLREWRNDIVHDFCGVSEKDLLNEYHSRTGVDGSPLDDMASVLTLIGRRTDRNPFDEAADLILKGI